ncbi:MAG: TonB family protein [Candidatus Zixiibacteriota bacterium]
MSILQSKVHSLNAAGRLRRFVIACTLVALLPMSANQLAVAEQASPLPKKQDDPTAAQKQRESEWPSPDKFIAVDSMPVAIHQETPVYPEAEKNAGIEGSVWVKVLVDRDGNVGKAILAKESAVTAFNDAALAAALKCTYRPAWNRGKKVAFWLTYEVKFSLTQPPK